MSFRLLSQQSFTIVLDKSKRVWRMVPLTCRNLLLQHYDSSIVVYDFIRNEIKYEGRLPFMVDSHIIVGQQHILLVGQKNVALFNCRTNQHQHYSADVFSSTSQFHYFSQSTTLIELIEKPKQNSSEIVAYNLVHKWQSQPIFLSTNKPFVIRLNNSSLLMEIHEQMTGTYYRQMDCQQEIEIINRCNISLEPGLRFLDVHYTNMTLYIVCRNDIGNIDLVKYSLIEQKIEFRSTLLQFNCYILKHVIGWTRHFLVLVKMTREKDPKHFVQLHNLEGACMCSLRDQHNKMVRYEMDAQHSTIYAIEKDNSGYFEKVKSDLPTVLKVSCLRMVEKGSVYVHLIKKMHLRLTNSQISTIVSLLG